MKAVIYARYSFDNQREESIEVRFASVQPLPKRAVSPSCDTISTGPFPQRPTIDLNSRT